MSKIFQEGNNFYLFIKGSLEKLITRSTHIIINGNKKPLTDEMAKKILDENKKLNLQAYRTLGIGYKIIEEFKDSENQDLFALENNIILLGFVCMIDPPREEVKEAIEECKDASIITVMLTGDAKETAIAIAEDIGILQKGYTVIEGSELHTIPKEQFENIRVFSRITPDDKKIIVEGYQSLGHLVAMTGDGVNDSVALEMADTGVAMGSGTDVAKYASDLIVLDNNFSSIVRGIREGRGIFNNIRKCIVFQLVNNLAELVAMVFFIIFFGVSLTIIIDSSEIYLWDIFNPNQLFILYLTTHTFPILALILDPYEKDIMKVPPRDPKEGIISKNVIFLLIIEVATIAFISCLIFYFVNLNAVNFIYDPIKSYEYHLKAQTMAFVCIFLAETWNVFNVRHDKNSMTKNYLSNWMLILLIALNYGILLFLILSQFGREMFSFALLTPLDWLISFGISFVIIIIVELYKYIYRKFGKNKQKN
ncbi:MAG: HAD-IC family P-type ATPase [Candidatus Helarchaeota archaeon]